MLETAISCGAIMKRTPCTRLAVEKVKFDPILGQLARGEEICDEFLVTGIEAQKQDPPPNATPSVRR
jgi:hypothetical protein